MKKQKISITLPVVIAYDDYHQIKETAQTLSVLTGVTVKGKEYFAEEKGYTLEYALVETIDLIERELEKDKIISTSEDWKDAREAKRFDPTDTEEVSEEINA